jgi:hypothetical protein
MIVNCFPRPVTIMTVDGVRETYDAGNGNVVRQGADLHEQFLGFRMFARTYEIDLPAPQYGVVYLLGVRQARCHLSPATRLAQGCRKRGVSIRDRRCARVLAPLAVFQPVGARGGGRGLIPGAGAGASRSRPGSRREHTTHTQVLLWTWRAEFYLRGWDDDGM